MTGDEAGRRPNALIATGDLAGMLERPDLVVLDVRSAGYGGGRAAFDAVHIPGSVHSDYVADGWRMTRGAAVGLLPEAETLSELFGRLGIRPDDHVVVVPAGLSSGDFAVAARIVWTFRAAGHARLSLLEGGFEAWLAEDRPVEEEPAPPPRRTAYPVTIDDSVRASLEDVARAVADGSAALVDSRGASFFAGREKSPQAARAGRLPGAIHVEGARAYDPATNRLRSRDELESLFAAVPAGPVMPYCNTGQAAATDWFALAEVLRRPDVRLFDGSMSEWTADPARPVETG